jgi:hypothetical protein
LINTAAYGATIRGVVGLACHLSSVQMTRESHFEMSIDKLFDITHKQAMDLIKIEED